jgi:hypothetical protein
MVLTVSRAPCLQVLRLLLLTSRLRLPLQALRPGPAARPARPAARSARPADQQHGAGRPVERARCGPGLEPGTF